MNLNNNTENVNRYEKWIINHSQSLQALEEAENWVSEYPENKYALEDLKAAKSQCSSVSEEQDRLLEETTQAEIHELDDFYQRAEANNSVLDLSDDLEFKFLFLSESYRNNKKPPNVDPNSLEKEEIAPDGLPSILDIIYKINTVLCVWDEQNDKIRRNEIIVRDIKRFFEANNWSIEKSFGYTNQKEIISAIRNPISDDDDFFAGIVSWHIGYYSDDFIPEKNSIEIQSKNILDKNQPVDDYDPSLLPPLLRDFIDEKCQETEADPIIIAQSAICSVSVAIGKKASIPFPNYFDTLYPNIWGLTIAPSGDFKTTAQKKGAQPAIELRNYIISSIKSEQKKFNGKKKHSDIEIKKHEKKIMLLLKRNPILPVKSTAEGLVEVLKDDENYGVEHNGGMIMASEFGEWAQNLERSHNVGYKPLLTNFYDVPQFWEYTTKTQGSIIVSRPFITINAVSTITWVKENIRPNDVSSGFFPRFLLFYPNQKVKTPPALPISVSKGHTLGKLITNLKRFKNNRDYSLSDDAKELFISIHDQMYDELGNLPEKTKEIIGPYLKRWSPSILKLGMIMEAVSDPDSNIITPASIMGGFTVVDYAAKSTIFLFKNELGESDQQRKQRKVLEYITKREGSVTRQQLLSSRVLDGGASEYDYVLSTLEEMGQIDTHEKSGRKRKIIVYELSTN